MVFDFPPECCSTSPEYARQSRGRKGDANDITFISLQRVKQQAAG
jgi:hypothetical protein